MGSTLHFRRRCTDGSILGLSLLDLELENWIFPFGYQGGVDLVTGDLEHLHLIDHVQHPLLFFDLLGDDLVLEGLELLLARFIQILVERAPIVSHVALEHEGFVLVRLEHTSKFGRPLLFHLHGTKLICT